MISSAMIASATVRAARCTLILSALLALTGCGRDKGLSCIEDTRYASSVEAPPLAIPDDLTVPDETDALRIPDRSVGGVPRDPSLPCLESPPDFFEGQSQN